ncbi:MAG: hypothetical protein JRN35_05345 [Nitrososphaerota archaeon]|nr:hypothetical protein [Nitrososphaerota archaeon]
MNPRAVILHAAVAGCLVAILVTASLFATWQAGNPTPDGASFLAGDLPFRESQFPSQYFLLRNYLISQGASYSLGFHTLLLPQNPTPTYLPFSVGSDIVPGFVGPSSQMYTVVKDIADNDSSVVALLALMGFKYLALIPTAPGDPWSGAYGPPSVGEWGPGGWFPQGNETLFLRMLTTWPYLSVVYSSGGLVVIQNDLYQSFAYTTTEPATVSEILAGNTSAAFQFSTNSPNVVSNGNLTSNAGWGNYSDANSGLLANGTLFVRNGSSGAEAIQPVWLAPNSTYELAYCLKADPGAPTPPPAGVTRDEVGVYWNHGTGSNITGAAVAPPSFGYVSNCFNYFFESPSSLDSIPAQISLGAQPPTSGSVDYVRYSQVSLRSGSNGEVLTSIIFPFEAEPLSTPTSFEVTSSSRLGLQNETIHITTAYSAEWQLSSSLGSRYYAFSSPQGFLEFNVTTPVGTLVLTFSGQASYSESVTVGFTAAIVLMATSALILSPYSKLRGPISRLLAMRPK